MPKLFIHPDKTLPLKKCVTYRTQMTPLKQLVDPKIYPIITTLNRKGLKTQFSCAGVGPIHNPNRIDKKHKRTTHFINLWKPTTLSTLSTKIEPFTIIEIPSPHILFEGECTNTPKMNKLLDLINQNNPTINKPLMNNQQSKLFYIEKPVHGAFNPISKSFETVTRVDIKISQDLTNFMNTYYQIFKFDRPSPHILSYILSFYYRQKIKWLNLMHQFTKEI